MMPVKREAALQAATQLGKASEPSAVRRELVAIGESVAEPKTLERQIGKGRRRLADDKSRMLAALEQHDIVPKHR